MYILAFLYQLLLQYTKKDFDFVFLLLLRPRISYVIQHKIGHVFIFLNFLPLLAGIFYNVKNSLSFITSKSLSENLSNNNKYLRFCCLQDKMWIKMPNWTIFLISSKVFVLITEIFWRTFWRNKWWFVFDVVKDSSFWLFDYFKFYLTTPKKLFPQYEVWKRI